MMQSENKLIRLLSFFSPPPSYTVVAQLGTEMSWGAFVFPAKGRDGGGLSVLFCLFELFKFSVARRLVSPPSQYF